MSRLKWLIGCSGFSYKEWKGDFYPEKLAQRKWFEYYCKHFNTLELNTTFYRYPTVPSLRKWYDQSPQDFVFSSKVPRFITHFRQMKETERMLNDFYQLLHEGLAEKNGCVLFQLPPQFQYSTENLERIISQVNHSFQNVIEFRHESWWRQNVYTTLKKHNITFCGVSFPKISNDKAIINGPVSYYRFHGVPKLFYSEYEPTFIESIFTQIKSKKKLEKSYVYFNNTASLAALHNARYMQQLVENIS